MARQGTIHRVTGETDVKVRLDLDGSGQCQASTGVPFLDHMLHQISSHGLIDLEINAVGDTHIDDHHTNCLLYTSPSPRDVEESRMPSSA